MKAIAVVMSLAAAFVFYESCKHPKHGVNYSAVGVAKTQDHPVTQDPTVNVRRKID